MSASTAGFYHPLTVLASAVVFVAGMVLIPYGIKYVGIASGIALVLAVVGMIYTKKPEDEFYANNTKKGGKDG
jgi:hypothetical protein